MSQILTAPATIPPGSLVYLADGSTTNVSASGTVTVADANVGNLLNAGFEYAASDPGPQSEATSSAKSMSASAGLADSVSRSAAGSAGLGDSVTRSAAVSTGLADSITRSMAVSS